MLSAFSQCLLYYMLMFSASISLQDVASKQSLCMLDTANTSTKVFEAAGWINIARFFWRMFELIKFRQYLVS